MNDGRGAPNRCLSVAVQRVPTFDGRKTWNHDKVMIGRQKIESINKRYRADLRMLKNKLYYLHDCVSCNIRFGPKELFKILGRRLNCKNCHRRQEFTIQLDGTTEKGYLHTLGIRDMHSTYATVYAFMVKNGWHCSPLPIPHYTRHVRIHIPSNKSDNH